MLGKHAAAIATVALVLGGASLGITVADHIRVTPTPKAAVVVATPLPEASASATATSKPTVKPTQKASSTSSALLK